jgi:hydrogenase maturation protease
MSYWEELERPGPDAVTIEGVEVKRRSRVRLQPSPGGDVFDLALAGKTAVVEEIVESMEGEVQLAVTIEEDPGRDLGRDRQPGHRFFFSLAEVEPLGGEPAPRPAQRILVAGIGNVFLGDDGFGVAVAARLARSEHPEGVVVNDFGIRGMDLAFSLRDYDVAILVDAVPRGEPPGTLYLIEPELEDLAPVPDAHGMDPMKVLALARELGDPLPRILLIGCEPQKTVTDDDELDPELSEPVRAAVEEAVRMVESLLDDLTSTKEQRRQQVS